MPHASEIEPGTLVRARVDGWLEAQIENAEEFPDPAVPTLEGVPEWVEGEVFTHFDDIPHLGIREMVYFVAGYRIEPDSVQVINEE